MITSHTPPGSACVTSTRSPIVWLVLREGVDGRSDQALLAAARTDADAFAAFYARHVDIVLGYLARRTDAETGADLCAETFATVLLHLDRFDAARGEPVAWLHGIARNLLGDYRRTGHIHRRAQRRLGMPRLAVDDERIEQIERLASLDVSAKTLREALDDLPAGQRDAVVARVVGESSYDEIGRHASISAVAARRRVSRGLAGLRNRIGGSS